MIHCGALVAQNQDLRVIDCMLCGYAHLDPLPTPSAVDEYYTNDKFYATHSPLDWLQREKDEHLANLWDSYYEWETRKFHSSPIMDIGCGAGYFGYYASHHACPTIGVEPSASARAFTNGKRIYPTIEEALPHWHYRSDNSVRMRLVLEHLLNPRAMLRRCWELMGPDGILEIVIPLEFNPLQNKLRKAYGSDWFVQPPHINYFTKKSIVKLLKSCNFEIAYEGATFPTELWWQLGYHYLGNDVLGHQLHLRRLNLEKRYGSHIFDIYSLLYRKLGWGREAAIFARKV
jgi:SAM-dependent methyltransferase